MDVTLLPRATSAQRWAKHIYVKQHWRSWPVLITALVALNAFRSWAHGDMVMLTLEVTSPALLSVMTWERRGFCQLIEEYETELRLLRPRLQEAEG
jgi:hypothetical protein